MDDSFEFLFTLQANDWVRVVKRDNQAAAGYFSGFDRATASINIGVHDRFPNRETDHKGKVHAIYADLPLEGLWRGVGIKTAATFEKFEVDVLGNLHRSRVGGTRPGLG